MLDRNDARVKIFYLASAIGLLTAAFIIAKTGRDALFFQGNGIFKLPEATLLIIALSVPLAVLFVRLMKSWGARRARIAALLFAAVALGIAAPLLPPGESPLLFAVFVFIPSIFGILFASLWLLASDLFENTPKRDATRAFSKLGASSLAGGLLGGVAAKALAPWLMGKWLVFTGAVLILVVVGLVWMIHRRFPNQIKVTTAPAEKNFFTLKPFAHRYARSLLFIAMAGALAGLLIDAQFYIAAASANMGEKGNSQFFANFYIMLNLGSLVLQLFLTPRVHDKFGLRVGLMILPFALVGGATFATAAATAFARSVLKVTEGGVRSSIHRSLWEQAFTHIESSERSFVKLSIDGVGARLAEGVGALLLFFWVRQVAPDGVPMGQIDTAWIVWLTLLVVIIWLALTQKLRVEARQSQATASEEATAQYECERFPDQCPCTTELGKDVA